MHELHVWIDGARVGVVTRDTSGRLQFTYDPGWLARPDATPLSLSMHLRPTPYPDDTVGPYLWGLLPDNDAVIERWARQYQCSASNVFGLLTSVGADVAGAAQYLPAESEPVDDGRARYERMDDAAIAELLRDIHTDATAWHPARDRGRWSLAGAQAKIALAHDEGRGWSIPHGRAPTTHIVKPAMAGLADHDLNELMCLRAAARIDLRAAHAELGHFDDERALIVRRFDRTANDDRATDDIRVRRVHQEDFSQALGVHPASKYQSDGGPSLGDMFRLLREQGTAPSADITLLSEAAAFNWLTLGVDAHAKNFSILLSGAQVRLAPLYDLGSMAPYVDHWPKLKLAQKIGGEYRVGQIGERHWRRLAADAGIEPDAFLRRIITMADALPDVLPDITEELDLSRTERRAAKRIADAMTKWIVLCRSHIGNDRRTASASAAVARPRRDPVRHPGGTPRGGQFAKAPGDAPATPAGNDD
jgi:serine/threonine-protein kinase HipA